MTEGIAAVTPATARRTTLTVAAVLIAVGSWQVYRSRPLMAEALIGLGAVLTIIALLVPSVAALFHRAWMALAGALGYVNTRILLCLVYFGLFTPIAAWFRISGHDPLARRGKRQPSYWIPRTAARETREDFERAF